MHEKLINNCFLFFFSDGCVQAKMRDLVSVQSAKEDSDNHSTIRRMKKLLPSVRALRNQFESKGGDIAGIKEPSAPRKWKSTSNFQAGIGNCDPAAMEVIERINRSRSNSLGNLTEDKPSSINSASSKTSISQPSTIRPAPVAEEAEDLYVSTVSIIQHLPDKETDYDMYRPRHSTAQWNPVSNFPYSSFYVIIKIVMSIVIMFT